MTSCEVQDDISGKSLDQVIEDNPYKRHVVFTGKYMQITVNRLRPGRNIHMEVHPHTDQFIRAEEGSLIVVTRAEDGIEKRTYLKGDGIDTVTVPAGTYHEIINPSTTSDATLYIIYAGELQHKPGEIEQEMVSSFRHL